MLSKEDKVGKILRRSVIPSVSEESPTSVWGRQNLWGWRQNHKSAAMNEIKPLKPLAQALIAWQMRDLQKMNKLDTIG